MDYEMDSKSFLLELPVELQFQIIKHLDRPSKLCLALTSPQMVRTFAKYSDLDRYRDNPTFNRKISVPRTVSFEDPKAQGPIIRWVAMPGADAVEDDLGNSNMQEEDLDMDNAPVNNGWGFADEEDEPLEGPYDLSDAGMEDAEVQRIMGKWLKKRCGVEGNIIFCAECWRFMGVSPINGVKPWCSKMLTREL